jgi:2-polyprenyl-3-methyl-5-hydroxy-6-metoxy-1,4-benzoquinol methylase
MTALYEAPSTTATEALVERLFTAAIDALEIASVSLGERLGLYQALVDAGPATADELATRTGTNSRYLREWLEQQATAGILAVDHPEAAASDRRYHVPTAHLPVLVDSEDLNFLAPLATLVVAVHRPIEDLRRAYSTGAGVPYQAYGRDLVEAIGAVNRPQFVNLMAGWLASIPEIDARLRAQPPARIADVACGTAWSSIAMARAYPGVTVDALDVDALSIDVARRNVDRAGLADRVHPAVRDAADPDLGGPYDLITIFEALHDMNHPVSALRAARASLAEGGSVLIADERVAETFTAPGDEIERLNYGFSVLHCLASGMIDPDSAATGTVLRPDTLRAYATEAGFSKVEVLPFDHAFWRFYRLRR